MIRDEFGETVDPNGVIGEEDAFDVALVVREDVKLEIMDAALRPSPVEACGQHVAHLALHKRMGSTPADRKILISDYIAKLKDYSEFAIFLACRYFWELTDTDFAPNLGKLAALVEEIESTIASHRARMERMQEKQIEAAPQERIDPRVKLHWKDLPRADWLPLHWEQYIGDAEKMIPLARQNPHVFNEEEYAKLAARRQHEHFEFQRGRS